MTAASKSQELASIVDGQPVSAWMVVITKPQREKEVRDRLMHQGFEVYLPFRLLDEVTAKRRGIDATPLFPRFLFARATLDAYRWQAIFNTIGVSRVLCDPKAPRGLKPEFLDRIRAREIDGFLKIGLRDPNRPAPAAAPPKDHRKWVSLGEVVDGLLQIGVDADREAVLVSLLNGNLTSIVQDLRKRTR